MRFHAIHMSHRTARPGGRRRARTSLALLLLAGMVPGAAGAGLEVVVLADPAYPPHTRLLQSLKQGLEGSDEIRLRVTRVTGLDDLSAPGAARAGRVAVAVGRRAAAAVMAPGAVALPVILTLVTRSHFELLDAGRAEGAPAADATAIFLDQPVSRRLRLLRTALPTARSIGVVLGPTSVPYVHELQRAVAGTAHLNIHVVHAAGEVMAAIERTAASSDVVLALHDPLVYAPGNMKGILLTTYRHRVPVIGSSRAHVRAGAVLAVYSSPAHIGTQLAELLVEMAGHTDSRLPPPAFPRYFDVAVNSTVAESLGIHVLPAPELQAILGQQERKGRPLR